MAISCWPLGHFAVRARQCKLSSSSFFPPPTATPTPTITTSTPVETPTARATSTPEMTSTPVKSPTSTPALQSSAMPTPLPTIGDPTTTPTVGSTPSPSMTSTPTRTSTLSPTPDHPISCELPSGTSGYVIQFSGKTIVSNAGIRDALTDGVFMDISPDNYRVVLISERGSEIDHSQESWILKLKFSQAYIATTNAIDDLGPNQERLAQVVEENLFVSSDVNVAFGYHLFGNESELANAVTPKCAILIDMEN